MPNVCTHGNLKRQCELCQSDDEIANLHSELTAKDMYYSKQLSELRAEIEKNMVLIAEHARLQDALKMARLYLQYHHEAKIMKQQVCPICSDGIFERIDAALAAQPNKCSGGCNCDPTSIHDCVCPECRARFVAVQQMNKEKL